MSETLRDKTVRGVGWSFADSVLGQGITFLVGIVLARLLTPDEYGLIGIVLIFINVLNGIVDSGLSNALIRKKDATDVDFSTVFIANLVLSLVTFGTLYVIAPSVSRFFGRPELILLNCRKFCKFTEIKVNCRKCDQYHSRYKNHFTLHAVTMET